MCSNSVQYTNTLTTLLFSSIVIFSKNTEIKSGLSILCAKLDYFTLCFEYSDCIQVKSHTKQISNLTKKDLPFYLRHKICNELIEVLHNTLIYAQIY